MRKAFVFLMGALSVPPTAPARDLVDIRSSKRLTVASATTVALPLEADLLGAFARAIGAELRVTPASSRAGALQAIAEGRVDVAAGGLVSQLDGQQGIAFTAEVFPSRLVAVRRRPAEPVRYLEQVRDLRILAPPGSGAAEALTDAKLPASRIDNSLTVDRALFALRERDAGLLSALNSHLHQLRSSPSWRSIIVRNLGEDAIQVLARSRLSETP